MTVTTKAAPVEEAFVGQALRRDDRRFVTGAARYIGDIGLPRMLHVAFVRSPHPHARIVSIDVEAARASAGVAAVVTGEELLRTVKPIRTPYGGTTFKESDWPALAVGVVRYVGEAVVAVVAADRYLAEDAAELVDVVYETLPPVVTMEQGLDRSSPVIHDEIPDNLFIDESNAFGDVDGERGRATHVVEATFRTQRSAAVPIECRGALADYDDGNGRFTMWASTQLPHVVRYGLAESLGVPESDIRVIGPDIGGAFGNKASLDAEEVVVCGLARLLRRPVKWTEDRRENFLASSHGQEERIWLRLSADADGAFQTLEADIILNGGAYAIFPDTPCNELRNCASSIVGPYRFAHYRYRARAVVTTTCPHGPIRGVARSQANFAHERLIDMLARRMGMDPMALRRLNLLRPEELPFRTVTGLERDSGDYAGALDMALEAIGYKDFRETQLKRRNEGRLVGVGVSCFAEECASGTVRRMPRKLYSIAGYDGASIRFDVHGRVTIYTGAANIGQGLETTMAQLAADELGVDPSRITVRDNDTELAPYGMGSTGSRTIVSSGGAVVLAARKLRARLLQLGAHILELPEGEVGLRQGGVYSLADPQRAVSIDRLAWVAFRREGTVPPGFEPGLEAIAFYDPPGHGVSSNSVHAVMVEIDPATGKVSVLRYVIVEDAGRLVNPAVVDGQMRGGATQGIGKALYEQVVYDDNGQMLNASLMDFLVPTASEACVVEVLHMESPSPLTVGGVKGCGESAIIGTSAAIGNAIVDALQGRVDMNELPFTPERVLAAVHAAAASG